MFFIVKCSTFLRLTFFRLSMVLKGYYTRLAQCGAYGFGSQASMGLT